MIGIFDSGFGGLTVFKEIKKALPNYSYIYLGDNARAPYGGRSQEVIFNFTKEAVKYLFDQGCQLVIIACNTVSAEALRKLQQEWLPEKYPDRRILGVIRPVVEEAVKASKSNKIGVIGTKSTISSGAYERELKSPASAKASAGKQNSKLEVYQNACPLLVPLIEEGMLKKPETRMLIKKCLRPLKEKQIDTLILGCTHYPLLMKEIVGIVGKRIKVLDAPKIVAEKLVGYLNRHPEIESKLGKNKTVKYLTTDSPEKFEDLGSKFMGAPINGEKIEL